MQIQTGSKVTLHFALKLENGKEIDSNFEHKPAVFVIGDEQMPENFTKHLIGLEAGDEREFLIEAEDAFGLHNKSNIQVFKKTEFAQLPKDELKVGLVLEFNSPSGLLNGIVTEVFEEFVKVDFNHPLAGKSLKFRVKILQVE